VLVASFTSSLTQLVGDYGLYAVFLLMLVDAVFPAGSEIVMLYGGAIASGAIAGADVTLFGYELESGLPAYLAIVAAGTIGYLIGAVIGWEIGDRGGRPFLERNGRWFHLDEEKLKRAEAWFQRWGDWAVFLGRLTPVVRSFVSIPAGVFEVPFRRYVVLTLLGSAIWCFVFAGAGWAAGASWESFHHAFRFADILVGIAIVALVVWILWRFVRGRREARR
jgi:membrane protein DedA with SNARE-associated domain